MGYVPKDETGRMWTMDRIGDYFKVPIFDYVDGSKVPQEAPYDIPSKFGAYAMTFCDAAAYRASFATEMSSDLDISTGDFCLAWWVRFGNQTALLLSYPDTDGGIQGRVRIEIWGSTITLAFGTYTGEGILNWYWLDGEAWYEDYVPEYTEITISASGNSVAGYNYVAVVRHGNEIAIYINGQKRAYVIFNGSLTLTGAVYCMFGYPPVY